MDITLYQIISFFIILGFSIVLSVQDYKRLEVSLFVQVASVICALVCQFFFFRKDLWIYVLSSLLAGAFYFTVRKLTKNKLGQADVWFGFFQGLFLLPKMLPVCVILEVIAALCLVNKRSGKKPFAFIPFMSFGLIITFIIENFFT